MPVSIVCARPKQSIAFTTRATTFLHHYRRADIFGGAWDWPLSMHNTERIPSSRERLLTVIRMYRFEIDFVMGVAAIGSREQ